MQTKKEILESVVTNPLFVTARDGAPADTKTVIDNVVAPMIVDALEALQQFSEKIRNDPSVLDELGETKDQTEVVKCEPPMSGSMDDR